MKSRWVWIRARSLVSVVGAASSATASASSIWMITSSITVKRMSSLLLKWWNRLPDRMPTASASVAHRAAGKAALAKQLCRRGQNPALGGTGPGGQFLRLSHLQSPICLAMISFIISRVPPPIDRMRASRYSRSTRLSRILSVVI